MYLLAPGGKLKKHIFHVLPCFTKHHFFLHPPTGTNTGHAFGGGAFLSLAHDYRIMTRERGWWCVPAATVGLQIPLPTGLTTLLQSVQSGILIHCIVLYGSPSVLSV